MQGNFKYLTPADIKSILSNIYAEGELQKESTVAKFAIVPKKRERLYEVDRDDLHQLIAYMYIQQASRGGLVYPCTSTDTIIPTASLNGYGGSISLYGLPIP